MKRSGIIGCLGLLLCSAPAAAEPVPTIRYTVEPGDTCTSIAKSVYGDAERWDLLHRHNDLSGRCWLSEGASDEVLPAGLTLILPAPSSEPDALVASASGKVDARAPSAGSWARAEAGHELFRSWQVNTRERSRAELSFRDSSSLRLRENTLVVIYGSASGTRRSATASLESGVLRSHLDALAGLEVTTPSSKAKLAQGDGLIAVEPGGATRVANHGGEPIAVSGLGPVASTVAVTDGNGTKVEKGKRPEAPRPLPPSPTWVSSPNRLVTLASSTATVSARWEPVPQAESYYVEFASDPRGVGIRYAALVPADVTSMEVQEVPPGKYWAWVSSVDADQFESSPSVVRTFEVVAASYPADARLADLESVETLVQGTKVALPPGVVCGGAEGELLLADPGGFSAPCEMGGRPAGELRAEVVAPTVAFDGPVVEGGTVRVRPGESALVELVFKPALPNGVTIEGVGLRTSDVYRLSRDTARIRVSREEAGSGAVVARVGSHELARLDVVVADPDVPYFEQAEARLPLAVGFVAGLPFFGEAKFFEDTVVNGGATGEVALTYFVTRSFAAELSLGLGAFSTDTDSLAWALPSRATALLLLETGRFRPYFVAGGGFLSLLDGFATLPFAYAGVGSFLDLTPRAGVRLEGGTAIAPVIDAAAAGVLQVRVGVERRF